MENLIYDVQSNILKFMTTTDMINLMNSSENAKLMFRDLSTHIGFIIYCDSVISDEQIEKFHLNNIKYKLLETIDTFLDDKVSFYRNGKLHRDNDLPAVIYISGEQIWYKNGLKHRDNDLPAIVIKGSNHKEWWQHGKCHRENDLPAIIYNNVTQEWRQHGKLHRENDLPAIIRTYGEKIWYKNGLIHRDNDLPAIMYISGSQYWYKNGLQHRDNDLPAVIYYDGEQKWYKDGQQIIKSNDDDYDDHVCDHDDANQESYS